MKYETYRRIRITSPFIVLLYFSLVAIVIGIIIPLQFQTGKDHLSLESPHPARFLSTIPPPMAAENLDNSNNFNEKEKLMQDCVQKAKSHKINGGCRVLDYMEIVESDGPNNLFISTFVKEEFQSRPKLRQKHDEDEDEEDADEVYFEKRIPQPWTPDEELSDNYSYYVAFPEEVNIRVEHRLKNSHEIFSGSSVNRQQQNLVGFLLNQDECHRLERGQGDAVVEKIFHENSKNDNNKNKKRVFFRGGNDTFQLKDLLEAAGLIDNGIDEIRHSGTHLDVSMYYSNLHGRIPPSSLYHPDNDHHQVGKRSKKDSSYSFINNFLVDLGVLPSPHPIYLYCVQAVLPHEGRFFFSTPVDKNPRQRRCRKKDQKKDKTVTRIDKDDLLLDQKEYRMIKTHFGVRAKFRETGEFGRFSASSFLRFVAACASLLSLPYTIVEFVFPFVIEKFVMNNKKKNNNKDDENSSSGLLENMKDEVRRTVTRHSTGAIKKQLLKEKPPEWWEDFVLEK